MNVSWRPSPSDPLAVRGHWVGAGSTPIAEKAPHVSGAKTQPVTPVRSSSLPQFRSQRIRRGAQFAELALDKYEKMACWQTRWCMPGMHRRGSQFALGHAPALLRFTRGIPDSAALAKAKSLLLAPLPT